MREYTEFAKLYDVFMDNVDYKKWAEYLTARLWDYGIKDGLILELGCGTGTLTELLSRAGYDMIGVDNSEEMLAEAREKQMGSGLDILYLLQDMQEFELYGTVRAVISACDSLNYILEEDELLQVFRLVNNYLDPGGLFLFDMNTIYKYQQILGEGTIAENRDEGSFIWENFYEEKSRINTYDLTLFVPREDGLYEKYEEVHDQRAYSLETITSLLEKAGLKVLAVYDEYTLDPPGAECGRYTIIAREQEKLRRLSK
ncbi:MAG TPA: class I SAM-dependent methyltransferase [Candidatus Blautia faecigallinarum]|uniref:Class I SAM-dependent methyltransferase n=1 Tax=Candidatus Blautia faecigallinarum TaxID=2838488 RepID=A0A9D2IU11_9FIRM|nr:class I SAM-dependent methyltransferase [Candidatus Blautia faecigallinarum]